MVFTTLYALSFAALAAAQSTSTTASILFPNADSMSSLVGSIAGADASATTYVVGCAGAASTSAAAATSMGTNSSDIGYANPLDGCGFEQSQTVVQGPSTFHWVFNGGPNSVAITIDCALSGTTRAVCSETASGSVLTANGITDTSGDFIGGAGVPPMTTATLTGSDLPPYQQVVITAGLSNLKAAGASSVGSAAPGKTTGSATSGGSNTASSSGSTAKSSSGAMAMEPALAMGVAGMLAVGLAAIAL